MNESEVSAPFCVSPEKKSRNNSLAFASALKLIAIQYAASWILSIFIMCVE